MDLDYEFELRYSLLLDLDLKSCGQRFIIIGVGLALDLKILGLQIWITIIIFYGIWSLKYLDYGFGFRLLFILLDLDLKVLGLRIWIMTNLDFTGFELGNT